MKILLSATIILLQFALPVNVSAQNTLSGSITDSSGNPIPYATVYIQELQHGTTANAMGNYELKLDKGTYTVFYQSLGYNQDFRQITLSGQPVVRNISLTVQYFQIPEVSITSSKEDPAYSIMRKAIARAPYYLNAVQHYQAEVYLKGTVVVNNIPRLMRKAFKANDAQIREGDKYLIESHNEIEFNAPDKYVHRLIAIQSNFPSETESVSPMNYIQASFYEPVIADIAISPLSPNAFAHYRFSYQGATLQGQFVINKIQVIPRRKSQQTFSGTIYIIEDLWCIHSLDLENENLIGKVRVRQVYTPVQDDFWMPVSHKFDVGFSMVGIKADIGYGSSVKYSEIRTNPSFAALPVINTIHAINPSDTVTPVKSKTEIEMEKLLAREDISNRDMVKLSKLIEKEAETTGQTRDTKRDLEIVETTKYIIEEDATKKSPDFWKDIRPIPLAEDEQGQIKLTDTLKGDLKEVRTSNELTIGVSAGKSSPFTRSVRTMLSGKTWRIDSNRVSINFGGLAALDNFSFNSVDGFKYDVNFRFSKRWDNGLSFSIYPEIGYAFSRKAPFYNVNSTLNYNRKSDAYFWLRTGDNTRDFNNYGSVNKFINSASSLIFKENYSRLYRMNFWAAGHRSEIANGVYLDISAGTEWRGVLDNSTEFSLFNRDKLYHPNITENKLIDKVLYPAYYPVSHRNYKIVADITILPFQRYRMVNDRKIPVGSNYPTINLALIYGLNKIEGEHKPFGRVTASVSHSKETGPMAELYWKVRSGFIVSNDSLPFQDFFHFNTQPLPVHLTGYRDAFFLPGFYTLATDSWFAEGHLRYTNPYLLVKYLPLLSNTLMRENLHLKYLITKQTNHYIEAGYSISEIFLLGEIGIFAGFEDFRFKSAGVKFILKFD
jgi:hypothetical protein